MYALFDSTLAPSQRTERAARVGLTPAHVDDVGLTLFAPPSPKKPYTISAAPGFVAAVFGSCWEGDGDDASSTPASREATAQRLGRAALSSDTGYLAGLNGSFSAIVFDRTRHTLTFVSDRFGSAVFYYAHSEEGVAAFPALRYFVHLGFPFGYTREALTELLLFRYIFSDDTCVQDVRRFPAATLMQLSHQGTILSQLKYWSLQLHTESGGARSPDGRTEARLAAKMGHLFHRAVERYHRDDQTVLLPLSGGFDSRGLLGALLELRPARSISTLTFGMPGTFDFEIGKRVAKAVGTNHHAIDMRAVLDRFEVNLVRNVADTGGYAEGVFNFPHCEFAQLAAASECAFTGASGGPLTGSHLKSWMWAASYDSAHLARLMVQGETVSDPVDVAAVLGCTDAEVHQHVALLAQQTGADNEQQQPWDWCTRWDFENRQRCYVIQTVPRCREAIHWALPFLDRDLLEFMAGQDLCWRQRQRLYRAMLARRYRRLFKMPTKNDDGTPLVWKSLAGVLSKLRRRAWSMGLFASSDRVRFRKVNYLPWSQLLRTSTDERLYQSMRVMISGAAASGIVERKTAERLLMSHRTGEKSSIYLLSAIASAYASSRCFDSGSQAGT